MRDNVNNNALFDDKGQWAKANIYLPFVLNRIWINEAKGDLGKGRKLNATERTVLEYVILAYDRKALSFAPIEERNTVCTIRQMAIYANCDASSILRACNALRKVGLIECTNPEGKGKSKHAYKPKINTICHYFTDFIKEHPEFK